MWKQASVKGTVKNNENYIKITDQLKIQHELRMFYKQLFKKIICNSNFKTVSFLNNSSFSVIINDFFNWYGNDLTKGELLVFLKVCKTPGNDRLTKEFHETFWNEIKCFSKVTKTS